MEDKDKQVPGDRRKNKNRTGKKDTSFSAEDSRISLKGEDLKKMVIFSELMKPKF